jgi:hypothetical protein
MTTEECLFNEIKYLRERLVISENGWNGALKRYIEMRTILQYIRDFAKINMSGNRALRDIYDNARFALED